MAQKWLLQSYHAPMKPNHNWYFIHNSMVWSMTFNIQALIFLSSLCERKDQAVTGSVWLSDKSGNPLTLLNNERCDEADMRFMTTSMLIDVRIMWNWWLSDGTWALINNTLFNEWFFFYCSSCMNNSIYPELSCVSPTLFNWTGYSFLSSADPLRTPCAAHYDVPAPSTPN